jgi:pyruvate dehydrogenase (quinone)
MADRIGDVALQRLAQWGVRTIYAGPAGGAADGESALGALAHGNAAVELVPAPHEELAALMACAHARLSDGPAVCLATSAPGAIHLLNGLYDARLDRQPVLAIVLAQSTLDLRPLLGEVALASARLAPDAPGAMHAAIDAAFRAARDGRGVACLLLANDAREVADLVSAPPPDALPAAPRLPADGEVRRAAELLDAGEQVALLVGAGAQHAADEIVAVADRLGACVAKTLPGKAVLPDDVPWVTGCAGPLGSRPSRELLQRCDTLLLVGTSFPYPEHLPSPEQARVVQIDSDSAQLGLPMPVEVALEGDACAVLGALLPRLARKHERRFRARIEADVVRWWQQLDARALDEAEAINPERVFRELSAQLPERCIVTCDAGSCAHWFARDVQLRRGMSATLSGRLAALGSALPYAIAAKYAQPGRPVLALLGDAAMQMHGIEALVAVARLWRGWPNPRLAIMVLNEGVADAGVPAGGGPAFSFHAHALPGPNEFPYAAYAELIGLRGIRVDHAEAVAPAWAAAFSSDVPTLVEMVTDPRVPALQPALRAGAIG